MAGVSDDELYRQYETINLYRRGPGAKVELNRPERMNAWSYQFSQDLSAAITEVTGNPEVRAVVVTGAGRAFSSGADLKEAAEQAGAGTVDVYKILTERYHPLITGIRRMPKPVIAAVNGLAVGGGHVLHVLCDLSIAAETARFGQAGPRVGSFDAGFGSAYLARVVGEKRAREMWYLCRLYDAATAERWGLVNAVVPGDQLLAEAKAWAADIADKSPTAIRFLKQSFNADTDHQAGLSNLAMSGLDLFTASPEGMEGAAAFAEKRKPDFASHVISH